MNLIYYSTFQFVVIIDLFTNIEFLPSKIFNKILSNLYFLYSLNKMFRRLILKPGTQLVYEYKPQKWGNKLGSPCPICKRLLRSSKAISLCQCLSFSHRQCFLRQFPNEKYQQYMKIRCKVCSYNLKLLYETQCLVQFQLKTYSIVLIILAMFAYIMAMFLPASALRFDTLQGVIFLVLDGMTFWIGLLSLFLQRNRNLVYVIPTKKSLNISAIQVIERDELYSTTQQQKQTKIVKVDDESMDRFFQSPGTAID